MIRNKEIRYRLFRILNKGETLTKRLVILFGFLLILLISIGVFALIVEQTWFSDKFNGVALTLISFTLFVALISGVISTYMMTKEIKAGELFVKVTFGLKYNTYIKGHLFFYKIYIAFTSLVSFMVLGYLSNEWLKSFLALSLIVSLSTFFTSIQVTVGIWRRNPFWLLVWTIFVIVILIFIFKKANLNIGALLNWLLKTPWNIGIGFSIVAFASLSEQVIINIFIPRFNFDNWYKQASTEV